LFDILLYCFSAALARYFITKKQEESYKQQNKHEAEKKRRAAYERKKEVILLRAVPELNVGEGRTAASFFFYMGGWFFDK